MDTLLKWSAEFSTVRYIIRTVVVVAWLVAGWWIVRECFRKVSESSGIIHTEITPPRAGDHFSWE